MPQYLSPGVYVEEVDSGSRPIEGVGTAVAAFLGLAASGPLHRPTLVSNWTQFSTTFGDFIPGSYLAHAVYGYFMNGGGNAYIVRIGEDGVDNNGKGDGSRSIPARAELPPAQEREVPYRVSALESGPAGNDITVEVTHPAEPEGGEAGPSDTFGLVVRRNGNVEETYEGLSTRKNIKANAITAVKEKSKLIRLEEAATGAALERPAAGTVEMEGGNTPAVPMRLGPEEYVGDVTQRTGVGGLETIDDVTMVCAPDLSAAYDLGLLNGEQFKAVQLAMVAHCELMGDRMAILDPPPNLNAQQIKEWRVDDAGYDSKYATLYWPRIKVLDPSTGQNVFVPPSGHMAGIWARNDNERGVHKAPANEVIRGAVSLEINITKGEQDLLNPEGINCLRSFPGRGVRVWGARTLSSDPAWRYVNVRRLFNYLEKSVLNNTDWVVFEPNDRNLWAKIRRTIASFLVMEWRKGALFGSTPSEAFFVKCDDETNPAEAIDAGQVMCQIGVAPVKPAEFVIFQLAQLQGGLSLVSE
jgi:phage tail sheath protein FI